MSLSGSINTMSVYELSSWLARRGHSGTLNFQHGSTLKFLTIKSGRVIAASSSNPREFFGQFLINFDLITEDQLQKAFETQQETQIQLGKILVMTGLLTEQQVHDMLALKIRETLLDVFLWEEGSFEFRDSEVRTDPANIHVTIDLEQLCQEGINRRNKFREIRQTIPNNNYRFRILENRTEPPVDTNTSAGAMIDLANQGYSVDDIILKFHSLDYPILFTLSDLVLRGWLEVMPPSSNQLAEPVTEIEVDLDEMMADEITSPKGFLEEAFKALEHNHYDQAIHLLQRGLADYPYDAALADALDRAEERFVETLRKELMSNDKIPYLNCDESALMTDEWTPAQRYILSRIDGSRPLRSIIMVSPLKEVDALRTFKGLLKSNVVALR